MTKQQKAGGYPKEKPAAFCALVSGRVQGVGFRYSALKEADQLGLKGWIRNTRDGDVEVWAEGKPENLELFIAWLRRGPSLSRVDSVNVENREPLNYPGFNVTV